MPDRIKLNPNPRDEIEYEIKRMAVIKMWILMEAIK
jgi:hypothetical protein